MPKLHETLGAVAVLLILLLPDPADWPIPGLGPVSAEATETSIPDPSETMRPFGEAMRIAIEDDLAAKTLTLDGAMDLSALWFGLVQVLDANAEGSSVVSMKDFRAVYERAGFLAYRGRSERALKARDTFEAGARQAVGLDDVAITGDARKKLRDYLAACAWGAARATTSEQ